MPASRASQPAAPAAPDTGTQRASKDALPANPAPANSAQGARNNSSGGGGNRHAAAPRSQAASPPKLSVPTQPPAPTRRGAATTRALASAGATGGVATSKTGLAELVSGEQQLGASGASAAADITRRSFATAAADKLISPYFSPAPAPRLSSETPPPEPAAVPAETVLHHPALPSTTAEPAAEQPGNSRRQSLAGRLTGMMLGVISQPFNMAAPAAAAAGPQLQQPPYPQPPGGYDSYGGAAAAAGSTYAAWYQDLQSLNASALLAAADAAGLVGRMERLLSWQEPWATARVLAAGLYLLLCIHQLAHRLGPVLPPSTALCGSALLYMAYHVLRNTWLRYRRIADPERAPPLLSSQEVVAADMELQARIHGRLAAGAARVLPAVATAAVLAHKHLSARRLTSTVFIGASLWLGMILGELRLMSQMAFFIIAYAALFTLPWLYLQFRRAFDAAVEDVVCLFASLLLHGSRTSLLLSAAGALGVMAWLPATLLVRCTTAVIAAVSLLVWHTSILQGGQAAAPAAPATVAPAEPPTIEYARLPARPAR